MNTKQTNIEEKAEAMSKNGNKKRTAEAYLYEAKRIHDEYNALHKRQSGLGWQSAQQRIHVLVAAAARLGYYLDGNGNVMPKGNGNQTMKG